MFISYFLLLFVFNLLLEDGGIIETQVLLETEEESELRAVDCSSPPYLHLRYGKKARWRERA